MGPDEARRLTTAAKALAELATAKLEASGLDRSCVYAGTCHLPPLTV